MATQQQPAHTGYGPLTPAEISFLAESEEITIVPRQRLDGLDLISGYIPAFRPPQRTTIPLWLALVLKKQKRCNIVPPPWLNSETIEQILKFENDHKDEFSQALPWRWLETSEILLEAAADDIPDASLSGERNLRVLLRDLREVRQTKARTGLGELESTYLRMDGLGLMEITELRGFAVAVVDGLRKLGAVREETLAQQEEEGGMDEDDDELETASSMRAGSAVAGRSVAGRSNTTGRSSVGATRGSASVGRSSMIADPLDDDF